MSELRLKGFKDDRIMIKKIPINFLNRFKDDRIMIKQSYNLLILKILILTKKKTNA